MKLRTSILLSLLCLTFAFAALSESVSAQETLIWTAWVYSDGSPTTSSVLEAGKQYRIVTKEIWWYDTSPYLAADAQYYTTGYMSWDWLNYIPAPDGHSFLQIDGQDPEYGWGPFSNGDTGHTYSIYYTGTGAPITFTLVDWLDNDYTNNQCHLPVEIWELPYVEEGFSPGYWGHQFKVYFTGHGSAQESWDDLVAWTAAINAYLGVDPPYFDGYVLPPVSSLLADSDLVFEPHDAYTIFSNNKDWHRVWLGLANWYNWAAGYGVYWDYD